MRDVTAASGKARGPAPGKRSFLFLQGPISPFFPALAAMLKARGHTVHRINVSLGDQLLWKGWFWPQPQWRGFFPEGVSAEDFHGRLSEWRAHVDQALQARGVTDLVLLGEQRPYHRIAIAAAKGRGVAVTAIDFGYIRPDWIIVERDGHNALSHFPRDPDAIHALAEGLPPVDESKHFADHFPVQARWDVLFHLANLDFWRFRHFQGFQLHPVIPAYLGTALRLILRGRTRRRAEALIADLPEEAPFFLFAMQMENDYSIRAYSPYPDMDTALREAVRSFARHAPPDAHLAVKVHPLDPGMKRWPSRLARMARQAGISGRVHLVDAIPLDPLILRAAGVVTVNSTAGIRALQLGKPVIAMGDALYRVPDLTHEKGLDSFWTEARLPDVALTDAFLRAIAHYLHVRGGFYSADGIAAAVKATAERLETGLADFSLLRRPEDGQAVTLAPERPLDIFRPDGLAPAP
ncbi:capsule biosynthesis protein [Roseococcus sp.]|uniref:capsule biosynthesis protein n=1 Tax=Roseococcus sp. TaxID=2109646 RepID=UPI003BA9FB25